MLPVRTTMTTTTRTALSVLAGALLLAACGGDRGSAGASGTTDSDADSAATAQAAADANALAALDDQVAVFCAGAQALYDQFVSAGVTDPTSGPMQEVYTGARALAAPQEINGDWQLILDSLEPLMTGQVDVNDPGAMQELNEQAVANAPAYERVGMYVSQNCEIQATTTTSRPTTAAQAGAEAESP